VGVQDAVNYKGQLSFGTSPYRATSPTAPLF
jgi:hypothetical protein